MIRYTLDAADYIVLYREPMHFNHQLYTWEQDLYSTKAYAYGSTFSLVEKQWEVQNHINLNKRISHCYEHTTSGHT